MPLDHHAPVLTLSGSKLKCKHWTIGRMRHASSLQQKPPPAAAEAEFEQAEALRSPRG
jgi:hypothetical protein